MTAQTRNYGMDALKIISMFMVIVLHILGQGGVLAATVKDSLNDRVAWLLELGAYSAVNIFAMTSGYLMFGRRYKTERILSIWGQVFSYSVVIPVAYVILSGKSLGIKTWLHALLPASSNLWWYFSCYFVLLLLIPYINKLLEIINGRQTAYLILSAIILTTISTVLAIDAFSFKTGYSVL